GPPPVCRSCTLISMMVEQLSGTALVDPARITVLRFTNGTPMIGVPVQVPLMRQSPSTKQLRVWSLLQVLPLTAFLNSVIFPWSKGSVAFDLGRTSSKLATCVGAQPMRGS